MTIWPASKIGKGRETTVQPETRQKTPTRRLEVENHTAPNATLKNLLSMRVVPTGGSTRASYAVAVIECLQQHGFVPTRVLGEERVRSILTSGSDDRISLADWVEIIEIACKASGDPLFTLKVAEAIRLRHIGVLGFLLSTCDTLAQAGQILVQYEPLLDGVNTVDLHISEHACTLTWLPLIDRPPASLAILAMAIWAHQIRWLTDRGDLTFAADFAFNPPAGREHLRALQATFRGPLRFNEQRCGLIAARSMLDLPISQRDPVVHGLLKRRADAELQSLTSEIPGLQQDIEALIMRELIKGDATLPHISKLLGMSPRTLQSRLACSGLNYRDLTERVRLKIALQHLSHHQTPLTEIATLLGYANQTGFQSAFKKWTGLTPGEFRRQQVAAAKS